MAYVYLEVVVELVEMVRILVWLVAGLKLMRPVIYRTDAVGRPCFRRPLPRTTCTDTAVYAVSPHVTPARNK